MGRHSSFYFTEKQPAVKYSHQPKGGTFQVLRFVKGLAPWKILRFNQVRKPKTLIFSNLHSDSWFQDDILQVQKLVLELRREGFKVFFWYDGTLNNCAINELPALFTLMNLASYVDIHNALPLHDLLPEQVLIVDYYWLEVLLENKEEPGSRYLTTSFYTTYSSNLDASISFDVSLDELTRQATILQHASPPVQELRFDEFSKQGKAISKKMQQAFPKAKIITEYQSLCLNELQVEGLAKEGILTIEEEPFTTNSLTTISHFTGAGEVGSVRFTRRVFYEKKEGIYLQQLLKHLSTLKTLELFSWQVELQAEPINLSQLNAISLHGSTISSSSLHNLLVAAENLKALALDDCTDLNDLLPAVPNLKLLEHCNIMNSDLPISTLLQLLSKAPQLQILEIVNCQNTLWKEAIVTPAWPKLRSIDIIKSTLSLTTLQTLLAQASNLSGLNISSCTVTSALGECFTQPLMLQSLRKFSFTGQINPEALRSLLMSMPWVEVLDLNVAKVNLKDFAELIDKPQLRNLHVLHMGGGATLTAKSLTTILANATQLTNLNLYNCSLHTDFSAALKPLALRKITLININTSLLNFHYLLNAAPQLTELTLTRCIFSAGALLDEKSKYANLDTLSINLDIHHADLVNLLTKTPNLTKLRLFSVKLSKLSTIQLHFPKLMELEVSHIDLTTENLKVLLQSAPALKKLEITSSNLTQPFTEPFHLLKLEEMVVTGSTIKAQQLKVLLRAAPLLRLLNIVNCPQLIIDDELEKLFVGIKVMRDEPNKAERVQSIQASNKNKPKRTLDCKRTIDADTTFQNHHHQVTRHFTPLSEQCPEIDPRMYRLEVFDHVEVNANPCDLAHAFTLVHQDEPQLTNVTIARVDTKEHLIPPANTSCFLGEQAFNLTGEWQAVASLTAMDKILNAYYEGETVAWCYSARDNLYYIKGKAGQQLQLRFLVKVAKKAEELPTELADMVSYFKKFGGKTLNLSGVKNPTGQDYLNCLLRQKQGACRQRAAGFQALFQQQYPDIPVRTIDNDCHSFVEVKLGEQWLTCDLGGHPGQVELVEPLETSVTEAVPHAQMPSAADAVSHYKKKLTTWEHNQPAAVSATRYCKRLLRQKNSKWLVDVPASSAVGALQLSLQRQAQTEQRPVFYIDSADDLICSAPFVHRTGDKGHFVPGPGGALYDFLKQYQESNPVLVVNYDAFDSDDIVRFNGLLDDKNPHADDTPLPPGMLVLGLRNPSKPGCYQGTDFYSRFGNNKETCPVPTSVLSAHVHSIAPLTVEEKSSNKTVVINLFHALDWQERLLGRWQIAGDSLVFVPGELEAVLAQGLPLEISNGLWEDERFVLFWRQAKALGYIDYAGRRIAIPATLRLIPSEGYEWQALQAAVTFTSEVTEGAQVLNPERLHAFFHRYDCKEKKLFPLPGLLAENAHQTVRINLTAELSDDAWAELLTECRKHHVHLVVCNVANVTIPQQVSPTPLPTPQSALNADNTKLVISSDRDSTIKAVTSSGIWKIIDVSECGGEDLVMCMASSLSKEGSMCFEQSTCALLDALASNSNILLTGHFSAELLDALAPVLLARKKDARNQVVLVSEQKDLASYLPTTSHQVRVEEKRYWLSQQFSTEEIARLTQEIVQREPLSQLMARLRYWRRHPQALSSEDNWQGLYSLPVSFPDEQLNLAQSEDITATLIRTRLAAINTSLADHPFVFIAGITGVGKSSFVSNHLKDDNTTLYIGEAKLKVWAEDSSSQRKILFIDEANINGSNWSQFEGLCHTPPGIVIAGKYYPLSPEHKVVFAGNPLSYGDERHVGSLFTRHGNSVVFEPLPPEAIYALTLKPLFTDARINPAAICQPLLEVYAFLCQCSADTVLMSPRELQMIVLQVLSQVQEGSTQATYQQVAAKVTYQLASTLVPEDRRALFEKRFKPATVPAPPHIPVNLQQDYVFTPSRHQVQQQLQDLLQLRTWRREKAVTDAQRFGGLGGLVIEGDVGLGKSELVMAILQAQGYQEVGLKQENVLAQSFYRMPVSMQLEDKTALLLKAFDEGAVVVIDEINSSPMMERLLNALLMGKTPQGQLPKQPGFLVIGTQNPYTMGGRRLASNALCRRLINTTVDNYTAEEMTTILVSKGIDANSARCMVEAYESNRAYAQAKQLTPMPTFRDLVKLAETEADYHKMKQFSATRHQLFTPAVVEEITPTNVSMEL